MPFLAYSWPGNIRELKNVIIGSVLRLDSDRKNHSNSSISPQCLRDRPTENGPSDPVPGDLDAMERTMVERCLRRTWRKFERCC